MSDTTDDIEDKAEQWLWEKENWEESQNNKRKNKRMVYQKKNYNSNSKVALEKELLVVELSGSGQWGSYIKANGEFYGMNEPLTNVDFQKGEAYTVLFARGKPSEKNPNGKKFIHQIVTSSPAGAGSSVPPATPEVPFKSTEKAPSITTTSATEKGSAPERSAKDNYAATESAKNKRILWQGVVQAVAQSPVFAGTEAEALVPGVKKASEELVAFILEKAAA